MFFLLYKHTDDGVFDNFPKIFQNCIHFPRIHDNFRRCPKIAEDFRERPDDTPTNLSTFDISEIIVSFLSICYHSIYHWLLYDKEDFELTTWQCTELNSIRWLREAEFRYLQFYVISRFSDDFVGTWPWLRHFLRSVTALFSWPLRRILNPFLFRFMFRERQKLRCSLSFNPVYYKARVFTGKYTTRKIYANKTKFDTQVSSPVRILICRFLMVICAISQFVYIQNRKKNSLWLEDINSNFSCLKQ